MDKYKIKDLAERLQKEETTELKNKMLFMWIKQEVISLQEYNELVKLILCAVSQRSELLKKWWKYFDEESVAVNCNEQEREEVINDFFNCG